MTSSRMQHTLQRHTATELEEKLPFHLKTLATGIRLRSRSMVAFAVGSLLLGLIVAIVLGRNVYQARTVLLYRPPPAANSLPAGEVDDGSVPSLYTLMDMVKVDTNLEEVRRRLHLKVPVEWLGALIRVDVPVNSSLMTITVTAKDPAIAAEIANATRQVFLEQELEIQRAQAGSRAKDLAARQEKVMTELQLAERNLKEFTIKNHVVDLDKEAGWYLQQMINTELIYEEAVGQNNASQLQQSNIDRIAARLESKVQAEEAQLSGAGIQIADPKGAVSSFNEEAIRGRVADLRMKEIDMDRAKALADDGIYSKRDYEKAKAAYEQERFLLYKDSPSAALYKEMNLRELDVQLAHISDQQKVSHLREAVEHVHARLDSLPLVQRDYLALSREVAIRASEREHIDQLLGIARRENESQTFGFSVVSEATPPLLPLRSNRRLLFLAISALGIAFGCLSALVLELLNRRLNSVGDAKAKLGIEVLAGFAQGTIEAGELTDGILALTNRLRQMGVRAGSRLVVASATAGEGAPELTYLLGRSLAAGSDSVSLVDGLFREATSLQRADGQPEGWRALLAGLVRKLQPKAYWAPKKHVEASLTMLTGTKGRRGFSELLEEGRGDPNAAAKVAGGIHVLPVGGCARPELLLSKNLDGVLRESIPNSDTVLLSTAPALEYPDATFLAGSVSLALLVVAAGRLTADKIERCAQALESSGIQLLGIVLTNIAQPFVERPVD